ncbi:MAG: hypothetical protein RQ715_08220 [Methylococcales bacterium]|nr:hypothetical protein [Methylococcales bacterium]
MTTDALSSNALIYAILALNSEIALQKDYLDSGEVPEDELDNEQDLQDDLEQAFMEFIDLYKKRLASDAELPSVEELLNSEL